MVVRDTSKSTSDSVRVPSTAMNRLQSRHSRTANRYVQLQLVNNKESNKCTTTTSLNVKDKKGIFFPSTDEELTTRDLSSDGFGMLLPIAQTIDDATGGWGLSYADLSPETETTPAGVAFLFTNILYGVAGLLLTLRGDIIFGTLVETAGLVSYIYHYSQLKFGPDRPEVRLALLGDYFTAGTALLTGFAYLGGVGVADWNGVPLDLLLVAGGSIGCLCLCWVWEFGVAYLVWHSLWHIGSAYTAFLVGNLHALAA
eukprot:CAMPEP_0194370950 /NCGR_PEP_ID=MMETSP0174-20130528/19293_1 /TAXON_ID=216777 /ORGANISM="Proboscia alata, Strain PI-D3" /LENGTH=255 /DNA_ID=CAMNT_0039148705 /DNA_START=107 /DNA_END=875 /DNA_ORIENTATION=+